MAKNKISGNAQFPFARKSLDSRCAGQHFGAWAIESKWFQAAIASVRNGTLQPKADFYDDDEEGDGGSTYEIRDDIAIICIDGQMTKRGSSFGGCSTVATRRAVRAAAADYMVRGILMHICSPGGTVSGTSDLADDVLGVRNGEFGKAKPVVAYIADMGCSAAYWVASQCESITANKTAMIGSIGTYTVLEDDTGYQDKWGVKYRVVSTGPFKGLGADGVVTDALVADVQREVDELNAPFLAAVQAGRGNNIKSIATVADGRAYVSEQAQALGLIDAIGSLDAAIEVISTRSPKMTPTEQVKEIAAEHPEAVASYIEQGKKAGTTDAHVAEINRLAATEAACPGRPALAISLFKAGKDENDAKLVVAEMDREQAVSTKAKADADAKAKTDADAQAAALAEKDKEIARLKFEQSGQGAIGTGGAPATPAAGTKAQADFAKIEDPKERAKAEWADNFNACRESFVSEAAFVGFRIADLRGGVHTTKA